MSGKSPITRQEELLVAADACCDPRTVRKAVQSPSSVRQKSMVMDRIRAALEKRGLSHLLAEDKE